jgi:anaerobic selenocysteine-containing dehydrogenase
MPLTMPGIYHKLETHNLPDKIVWSTCNVNCGSRCPVRLHVKNGSVVRVETDITDDDSSGTGFVFMILFAGWGCNL